MKPPKSCAIDYNSLNISQNNLDFESSITINDYNNWYVEWC